MRSGTEPNTIWNYVMCKAHLERDFLDFLDFSFDLDRDRFFFFSLDLDRDFDLLGLSLVFDFDLDLDLTAVLELDLKYHLIISLTLVYSDQYIQSFYFSLRFVAECFYIC